ncbi:MAG: rhodanese-like domain-containing protein [Candidatus Riflebacteria bacterium]|nr:rhodanese-like domain-containing protein [Candidatus Riflebacteria bacterium]
MRNIAVSLILTLMLVLPLMASPKPDGSDKEAVCPDGSCGVPTKDSPAEPAKINTSALESLLQSKIPILLFDARMGKFDDGNRIPGAKALGPEAKPEEVAKAIPSKEALVVTYCVNLKCGASHMLYKHLKELGYKNLLEYPEGIEGWVKAGNQVVKAE